METGKSAPLCITYFSSTSVARFAALPAWNRSSPAIWPLHRLADLEGTGKEARNARNICTMSMWHAEHYMTSSWTTQLRENKEYKGILHTRNIHRSKRDGYTEHREKRKGRDVFLDVGIAFSLFIPTMLPQRSTGCYHK